MAEIAIGTLGAVAPLITGWIAWQLGRRAEFALAEWIRDLRRWAAEAVGALTDGAYVDNLPNPTEASTRVACRLSALIDEGRLFLPNQQKEANGASKPFAYRGYRHSALDPLVAAVTVLDSQPDGVSRRDLLVELKREFVSEISQILQPEVHNREVARLIRTTYRHRSDDTSAGGLLPGAAIPRGAGAVLAEVGARIRGRTETRKKS
jgi:hypothetical protein